MDGYVNYGEEFAGMSRRQVRRCHRLHILATSSQKRQILMLQRLGSHLLKEISTFISDTFAERYYVLIFDITWMMDISLNDTSYLDCLSTRDIFAWTCLKKAAFS